MGRVDVTAGTIEYLEEHPDFRRPGASHLNDTPRP